MDWLRCQMLLHCYERANAAYLDDFALLFVLHIIGNRNIVSC